MDLQSQPFYKKIAHDWYECSDACPAGWDINNFRKCQLLYRDNYG